MINEPDSNLRALIGVDGSPITCMVGDQVFRMGPLQPADYMVCAQWRASEKVALILRTMPDNPLMDVSSIKAEACAKVLAQPCLPFELLTDIECVCRLAEISLQRGGEFKGNWEGFKRNLSHTSYKDLERAVFKVSGFLPAPEDNGKAAVPGNPPMQAATPT